MSSISCNISNPLIKLTSRPTLTHCSGATSYSSSFSELQQFLFPLRSFAENDFFPQTMEFPMPFPFYQLKLRQVENLSGLSSQSETVQSWWRQESNISTSVKVWRVRQLSEYNWQTPQAAPTKTHKKSFFTSIFWRLDSKIQSCTPKRKEITKKLWLGFNYWLPNSEFSKIRLMHLCRKLNPDDSKCTSFELRSAQKSAN